MKLTQLIFFLSFIITQSYAQQLFGHINSQEIVSVMPEAATAQLSLQQELESLEDQAKMMMEEYESQKNDLELNSATLTDVIRNDKLKSLQNLEERIMLFQQSAQESIRLKEAELFEPILTKIQTAIDVVAKQNGYSYVFDISSNAGGLVYKDDSFDMTELVKKQLNL